MEVFSAVKLRTSSTVFNQHQSSTNNYTVTLVTLPLTAIRPL